MPFSNATIAFFLSTLVFSLSPTAAEAGVQGEQGERGNLRKLGVNPKSSEMPAGVPTACSVSVDMTCTEATTGVPCSEYPDLWYKNLLATHVWEDCLSDPIEIQFLYTGGTCDHSYTSFDANFECIDYNGGPPTNPGEVSRVKIESATVPGLTYYDNLVALGDTFSLENPSLEPIVGWLNISIYDTVNDTETGSLLQSVQVLWECKSEAPRVSDKDRYGAFQFIGFTSIEQGQHVFWASSSSEMAMLMTVNIKNVGVTQLVQKSLMVATSFEPFFFNFTDDVTGGGLLHAGESFNVEMLGSHYMLENNSTTEYLAFVAMTGANLAGSDCRATEVLDVSLPSPNH